MKLQLSINRRLYTLLVVFGVIGTLGLSMQSAFADPDPAQGYLQSSVVQGTATDIQIDQAASNALTISNFITVYDTDKTTSESFATGGLTGCPTSVGAGIDVWQLVRSSDDAPIGYKFAAGGILGQVKTKYGTGVGTTSGNTVTVTVNGDTTLRFGSSDGTLGASATAYWKKVPPTVNNINTDNLGFQSFLTCGTEGSANFHGGGQVEIVKPVGGEIIPVSTTALLLAGFSTSALWLIPLTVVAAGSFAVLRFQVYRK
jgi:hypothetical protein